MSPKSTFSSSHNIENVLCVGAFRRERDGRLLGFSGRRRGGARPRDPQHSSGRNTQGILSRALLKEEPQKLA